MWQRVVIVSTVLVVSLTAAAGLRASTGSLHDPTDAKQQLLKLEDQWLQGLQNPNAQEQILADDFVHALASGFITKKDQLDYLRNRKQSEDGLARHFDHLRVRIYGTAGIVNGMVVTTDRSGKVIKKKSVFTDVFAYRDGRWQAVNAQENEFQPSSSH
jgi:hypothetical protein